MIKRDLTGEKWGILNKKEQEFLLNISNCVDGRTCETAKEGKCIVDFEDYNFSISGEIKGEEIIINDDAIFYDPTK